MSSQYHVVFDDNFTIVPFMNSGEIPPNWEDLVQKNRHMSTEDDFHLDQEWNNNAFDDVNIEERIQVSEGEDNSPKRRKMVYSKDSNP